MFLLEWSFKDLDVFDSYPEFFLQEKLFFSCVLMLEVIQLLWGLHLNLGNPQFKKRIENHKYKTSNKTESLFKVTKDIYHTGKSAAKSHKHEI